MGFFLVLKAELVRSLIIMRRYWFAALTGITIGYSMLIIIIYAFMSHDEKITNKVRERLVGPEQTIGQTAPAEPSSVVAESTDAAAEPEKTAAHPRSYADKAVSTLLNFLIGVFAFGVVGMFSQGLSGMAQSGELEQLCMSPHGLVGNFLARAIVSSTSNIITSSILLALIVATVKGALFFSPAAVPILALTFANLIGFGFMIGGLTLVFKQIGQVAMILRLALLGLAMMSEVVTSWPFIPRMLAHLLPITDAALCLRSILIDNAGYGVFLSTNFYALIVSCVIWTSIGIACFRYMENWSRDKGTLGAY